MPLICEPTGEEPCYSKISTSDFGAEQRHKAWNNEKRPRWVKITMAMKYHVKLPTVTWLSPQCAKQRVLKLRLLSLILRETSLPRSRFLDVTQRGSVAWHPKNGRERDYQETAKILKKILPVSRRVQLIKVVYHLHGRTGRVMVWVNGRQNSRLVNFVLWNRVYHLHKSVQFTGKSASKVWDWYWKMAWGNGRRISVWKIPFGKKRTIFSDV